MSISVYVFPPVFRSMLFLEQQHPRVVYKRICYYLRLVHVIILEQPEVGGREAELLFRSIKARED